MNRISRTHAYSKPVRFLRTCHKQHQLTHTTCRFSTTANPETIRQQCLAVLRTIAQPVSVLTTLNWEDEESHSRHTGLDGPSIKSNSLNPKPNMSTNSGSIPWHGTTLSSLTSIAMYPYPLISFALRTPARMADLLRPLVKQNNNNAAPEVQLAINLLTSHQSHLAIHFSQPRSPSASSGLSPLLSIDDIKYTCTADGIPILHDTLGALCCTLIKSIPLDTIHPGFIPLDDPSDIPTVTSELFIARIMHVRSSPQSHESSESGEELLPLIYHKQQYRTIK